MDLSSLDMPEWLDPAKLAALPDTVWAALVSAVVTLALALALLPRRAAPPPAAEAEDTAQACHFLINGSSIRPLTPAARTLLEGLGTNGSALQTLSRHLERDCASIRDDLEGLILFGEGFRRHCIRADGTSYEVLGRPRGGAALLAIRPASDEVRALDAAGRALARTEAELAFQRSALDRAPVLVWTLAPDGQVTWANAAYRERFEKPDPERREPRLPNGFAHVLEEVPLTARPGCESRRRVMVSDPQNADSNWFEISELPLPSGETIAYALEADDLVAAEASLRRFVETLTETFAHLPIGLAVFDKNRRLGLFNPALCDLVKIDAVWLAGRPSLRDFLERLRETRQMPEQKDFAAFRRMLTELEEGARDGTYEENWQLPSGKIFRVSGRPHPQGALAFLFEDISTAIQLERRYRSELELSQATLDRMSEAVAVFDTSGMLVFVNSAFEGLWGLDPMASLEGPGVGEMTALWEERCGASPVWCDLRAFATGAETRTSWTATVETGAGRALRLLVAPLPNGSTLVIFRDHGAGAAAGREAGQGAEAALARAALLGDLAFGRLELPAEAALASLGAAIAAAPSPAAFAALTGAARALSDGLAEARAVRTEAEAALATPMLAGAGGGAALANGLECLLAARGLTLGPVIDRGEGAAAELGRALPALALAITALAAPAAAVELAIDRAPAAPALALRAAAGPEAGDPTAAEGREPPVLALTRRRLAALGATLEVGRADGRITVAARFPAAGAAAAPRRLAASRGA